MFCSLPHNHEGTSSNFCTQCATVSQHKSVRKYRTSLTRLYALHQAAVSKVGKSRCARLRRAIHGQLQTAISELPPLPQRAAGAASTSYNDDSFDIAALYTRSRASSLRSSKLASNAGVNLLETARTEQDVQSDFIQLAEAALSSEDAAAETMQPSGDGSQQDAAGSKPVRKVKAKRKRIVAAGPAVADDIPVPPQMLTSALRGCSHWSDVRKLWESYGPQLNSIHMSASIWKLSDLVPPSYQRQMSRHRRRALDLFLMTVLDKTQALADAADFRTAANIAMGLAKLVPRVRFPQPAPNAAPLSERAAMLVTSLLSSWQCRVAAQDGMSGNGTANGAASNGSSSSSSRPGAKPVDFAQMLWAAAKFLVVPGEKWMQAFYRSSLPQLHVFKREELVITLYSLAVLKLKPEESWAAAFCDALSPCLEEMSIQEIADVTWSLARLQLHVSPSTAQAVISAASLKAARLHVEDPKGAASSVMLLIWGLGKLHSQLVLEPRPQAPAQVGDAAESGSSQSSVAADSAAGEEGAESERVSSESRRSGLPSEEAAVSREVGGYSSNGVPSTVTSTPFPSASLPGTTFYTTSQSDFSTPYRNGTYSSPTPTANPYGMPLKDWRSTSPSQPLPNSLALQAAAALFASASSPSTSYPLPSTTPQYSTASPLSNGSSIKNGAAGSAPLADHPSDNTYHLHKAKVSNGLSTPSASGAGNRQPPSMEQGSSGGGNAYANGIGGGSTHPSALTLASWQQSAAVPESDPASSRLLPSTETRNQPATIKSISTSSSDGSEQARTAGRAQPDDNDEDAEQLPATSSGVSPSFQGLQRPRLPVAALNPRGSLAWQVARVGSGRSNNIFSPDSSWEEGYEYIFPNARSSQWKPDRGWIAAVCRWSIPLLSHCQPRELAAALHGWANLATTPDPLWLDQFFSITPQHFNTLSVKEIATICWALGRLQERPPVTWMRRFVCEMAARDRHDYSRAEMLQIVWCMQQLRVASVHLFSPEAVVKLKTNRHVFHAFLQRLAHARPRGRIAAAGDRRSQHYVHR